MQFFQTSLINNEQQLFALQRIVLSTSPSKKLSWNCTKSLFFCVDLNGIDNLNIYGRKMKYKSDNH